MGRDYNKRSYGTGICEVCGKEFDRRTGNQRYCGLECQQIAYERSCMIAESALSSVLGSDAESGEWQKCKTCGKMFKLKSRYSRALYCCDDCRKKAAKQRAEESKRKYERRMKRTHKVPKDPAPPPRQKDGFTWDEIRGVLGEYKINSYQKAVEILQQRKAEKEAVLMENEKKGGGEE